MTPWLQRTPKLNIWIRVDWRLGTVDITIELDSPPRENLASSYDPVSLKTSIALVILIIGEGSTAVFLEAKGSN